MTPEGYTRVYVGGLNENIKKEDLQTEFEKYGKLNKVWVAFNPPGFAFIEFVNTSDAELACDRMNGMEIMGAKLRVELSRGKGVIGGSAGGGGRSRDGSGGFRGSRGSISRDFGSRVGAGSGGGASVGPYSTYGDYGGDYPGYRSYGSYGSYGGYGTYGSYGSYGTYGGGYYASRTATGDRGRGRYEDYPMDRVAGGYLTHGGYPQDSYGFGTADSRVEYYTDKDSMASRYRSRSPAGRDSHRHLRECT